MDVWDELNNTLSILVWPAVVGASLWAFRHQVVALLGRLRKLQGAGGQAEFDPIADRRSAVRVEMASKELNEGLADDVKVLLPEREADDGPGGEGHDDDVGREGAVPHSGGLPSPDDAAARDAVYGIIRAAAAAGWDVAVSGRYASRPTPQIEWAVNSTPKITGWEGQLARRREQSSRVELDAVTRLEDEIRKLTLEAEAMPPASWLSITGHGPYQAHKALIRDLREQLRVLDPWSPYA